MAQQYFGDSTRLVPPLTVDGELYGMAIKFTRQPTNQTAPVEIVSGQVVSATNLSGSRKRIVCRRGFQTSSYTLVPGGGSQPFEITYRCQTGGNICHTTERERVNNFANPQNYAGPDFGNRLRAGDVIAFTEGEVVKRYTITEASAFEQAPSEVDWQGSDPLPVIQWITCDNYAVQMVAGDGENFSFGEAAPFDETGVFDDAAATMVRRIFNSDAGSYESDADLLTDEYWSSPDTGVFYFGESATATVEVFYWQQGFEEMPAAALQKCVIECETDTPAGIDTDSDEIATSSEFYLGDFSEAFFLQSGACVLEYRKTLYAGSQCVGIGADIDFQSIDDAYQRSTLDGTVAAVAYTEHSPDPWGIFRVRKVGMAIFFEQAVAGDWELVKEFAVTFSSGFLSVGTTASAKFFVYGKVTDDYERVRSLGRLGVEARQSKRVTTGAEPYRQYTTVPLASSEDIEDVTLFRSDEDAEVSMALRGTLAGGARNKYHTTTEEIVLYPEANGDRVRVTYAAPTALPGKPGIPPQVEGNEVVNFGTKAGGSGVPGEATANVSENRGNWHDVIVYHDPHDDSAPTAGQAFDGERGAFASSQFSPALEYDVRDGAGDWATIPTADRLWYAPEGILLLRESFRAGIDGSLCVRCTFTESGGRSGAFLNNSGIDAQQINELLQGIATMRDLWVSVGTLGVGISVSGVTDFLGPGPTSWDCGNGGRQSARAYGTFGNTYTQAAEDSIPNPAWNTSAGNVPPPVLSGANSSYSFMDADWRDAELCAGVASTTNGNTIQPGMFSWAVFPYGGDGLSGSESYTGCALATDPAFSSFGRFRFTAPSIGIDKKIMRLLRGATCIEAKARVRFQGLSFYSWSMRRETLNGVIVEDSRIINGTETVGESFDLSELATASGTMGFSLVGRRRITRNITSWNGTEMDFLDGDFRGFPASIVGGSVQSDEWSIVDVTNVVQSMIDDKDSTFLDYYLWPSRAGVTTESDASDLSGYLEGLIPTGSSSIAYEGEDDDIRIINEVSGSYAEWDSLDIQKVYARFDIPGTRLNEMWLPLFLPPQAPAEE